MARPRSALAASVLTVALVLAGQAVAQGALVGTTGATVHFGGRRGMVYLDPELLLAGGRLIARLVPTSGARPRGAAGAPARAPPISPTAPERRRLGSATMA